MKRRFNNVAKPGVAKDAREFLALAACGSHALIEASLANHGLAMLEVRDEKGRTPLIRAAETGHSGAIHLLVKKGADINAKDGDGNTALMAAALKGFKGVAEKLLDLGAEVNLWNFQGQTALLLAATHRNNNDGKHPMSHRKKDTVRLLLDRNARIDVADNKGNTPAAWAQRYGYRDVAAMITAEEERRRQLSASDIAVFTDGLPETITFNSLRLKRPDGKSYG
ncbi:MAG: ankyrin repeat domain-containing protein [Alphaproteobacteria bacterium]